MSKCNYCAFYSHACRTPDWDGYARGIIDEIRHWGQMLGRIKIPTIFFGGGTPSLMPVRIFDMIIHEIGRQFQICPDCEITLESNPGTLDDARLGDFIAAGANRISIGVQSLNDRELAFLGRRHDAATALALIHHAMARNVRTSCDFIYGIPGQSTDDVIKLCRDINDLGLTHCSMYELTIEPDTPFGKMNIAMPSNETMADMYNAIGATLSIPRYEVSNYAHPSDECRHNQNIWAGAPYIGIGRGAAGRPLIDGAWYEQLGAGTRMEQMNMSDRAIEMVITGMRTMRGVTLTPDICRVINNDFIDAHPELITRNQNDTISATANGLLILDDLLVNLVK